MPTSSFHIQRGDDVQTSPKNDIFQSFNLQSKWGRLEAMGLADGKNSRPGRNRLTQLAIQNTLAELRERANTSRSIEAAIIETLQTVHQYLREQRLRTEEFEGQSADLAIAVLKGDSVYLAVTGSLGIYHVKGNSAEAVAGFDTPSGEFGTQPDFEPVVKGPITLANGDDMILASDGLHGGSTSAWKNITKQEMLETLKSEKDLKRAAKRLVSYPLGRNIEEDVSVVIIRNPQKEKANKSPVLISALIGLGLLGFFVYRYATSTARDEELYTVLGSSGEDYIIEASTEDSAISSATYDISTGNDWISLQIPPALDEYAKESDTELNVGQQTSLRIANGERFLAEINQTNTWLFLQNGAPQRLFTIKLGEYRLDLEPPQPGAIGVLFEADATYFYCFRGRCSLLTSNDTQLQPIASGTKAILIDGNYTLERITSEEFGNLEENCSCSLR